MSLAELSLRYAAFAVLATLVNLLTQDVSLRLYEGVFALYLAMAAGTLTGLVTKYLLDKRWIFGDRSAGWANHSRKFTLYSLMGVATTLIFWVSELTFEALFGSDIMRNLGAVIGLAIGYTIKYRLDRRFVFVQDGARDGAREGAA
jgi:putative flippase GtrA